MQAVGVALGRIQCKSVNRLLVLPASLEERVSLFVRFAAEQAASTAMFEPSCLGWEQPCRRCILTNRKARVQDTKGRVDRFLRAHAVENLKAPWRRLRVFRACPGSLDGTPAGRRARRGGAVPRCLGVLRRECLVSRDGQEKTRCRPTGGNRAEQGRSLVRATAETAGAISRKLGEAGPISRAAYSKENDPRGTGWLKLACRRAWTWNASQFGRPRDHSVSLP